MNIRIVSQEALIWATVVCTKRLAKDRSPKGNVENQSTKEHHKTRQELL